MKLKKTEICAIVVTAIFAALVFGFYLGENREPAHFGISAAADKNATDAAESIEVSTVSAAETGAGDSGSDEKAAERTVSFPININTATEQELQALDGIGETLAERIVEYRRQNGNFASIQEIVNVRGIGSGIFEKISSDITVQ